jgi:uncharacterized protein (TIGR02147 family)
METTTSSTEIVQRIRSELLERKNKNPLYSLRAFARDLGLSPSHLSRMLSGERLLSPRQINKVADELKLSSQETTNWHQFLIQKTGKASPIKITLQERLRADHVARDQQVLEIETFRVISDWIHFAILEMTYLQDFQSDSKWISKKLGIDPIRVDDAVDRLFLVGLLKEVDGKWVKHKKRVMVSTQGSREPVRRFTKQTLELASKEMEPDHESNSNRRCMPGITLPISSKNFERLKTRILEFQQELAALALADDYDEVYHLQINFFPLTQIEEVQHESQTAQSNSN